MLKGSADKESVFKTVRFMMNRGLTFNESIKEIESILRNQIPDEIKNLIRQECKGA